MLTFGLQLSSILMMQKLKPWPASGFHVKKLPSYRTRMPPRLVKKNQDCSKTQLPVLKRTGRQDEVNMNSSIILDHQSASTASFVNRLPVIRVVSFLSHLSLNSLNYFSFLHTCSNALKSWTVPTNYCRNGLLAGELAGLLFIFCGSSWAVEIYFGILK